MKCSAYACALPAGLDGRPCDCWRLQCGSFFFAAKQATMTTASIVTAATFDAPTMFSFRPALLALLLLPVVSAWVPQSAHQRRHLPHHLKTTNAASTTVKATTPNWTDAPDNALITNSNDQETSSAAHLVFPGGGIFFYWQAGAVTYLREAGYDLSECTMSGASAGALTATLTTNDVCFTDATNLALSLAEEAGVWDRSGGLQGVWGAMIERWLDELLPDDAHITSSERLALLVTPVPSFGKTRVTQFQDKRDLIRANMASVHLPWFLDGNLTTEFREKPHIDGSFLSKDHHYVPEESRASQRAIVTLDWTEDEGMATEFGDFVKLVSKEGIWGMLEQGKSYAASVMEARGDFKDLPRKEKL